MFYRETVISFYPLVFILCHRYTLIAFSMKIIAVVNQKGGSGKTPTAVHLAFALSRAGKRVLFIDTDAQASASLHFLGLNYKNQNPTLYNAITTLTRIDPLIISPTIYLIPTHDELERAEVELTAKPGYFYQVQLAKLLKQYPGYDYCIIDTPGSRISIFTTLALTAANLVIVPVKTEFSAHQATLDTMSLIEDVKSGLNPHLTIWGILPNQYESNVLHHQEILDLLREQYKTLVYEPSRKTTKYNDAMAAKTDVGQLDPLLSEYWNKLAGNVIGKGQVEL